MNTTNQNKLKRALWLAFQASSPMGLGHIHRAAAGEQTEDSLYETENAEGRDSIYTDYVFGRMMKTRFSISDEGALIVSPENPRGDYQSWAHTYATGSELVKAVEESLTKQPA